MISIHQACDYLITRALADRPGQYLSVAKLHHLLYYSQAWHLAIHRLRLFERMFEAWREGPVSPAIHARLRRRKLTYSALGLPDRRPSFDPKSIPEGARALMDAVLTAYARRPDAELASLLRAEGPWMKARGDLPAQRPSRSLIDEDDMRACCERRPQGLLFALEELRSRPRSRAPLPPILTRMRGEVLEFVCEQLEQERVGAVIEGARHHDGRERGHDFPRPGI